MNKMQWQEQQNYQLKEEKTFCKVMEVDNSKILNIGNEKYILTCNCLTYFHGKTKFVISKEKKIPCSFCTFETKKWNFWKNLPAM